MLNYITKVTKNGHDDPSKKETPPAAVICRLNEFTTNVLLVKNRAKKHNAIKSA